MIEVNMEFYDEKSFTEFIDKFIINKKGKINSNSKRYGYFEILSNNIDYYQKIGNSVEEKLYLYYNKIDKIKTCEFCGKELEFIEFCHPYRRFCSKSCASYGSMEKKRETNLKRYGRESYTNPEKRKNTNLKRYGFEFFNYDLIRKNNLEKYGVEYSIQSKKVQDKIKKTNLKKYGCERQLGRKEIQEKGRETKKKRYGNEYYSNTNKSNNTKLKRFGNKFGNIEKAKQTNLEKYGVEYPVKSNEIKNKMSKSRKTYYYNRLFERNDFKIKPLFLIQEYCGVSFENKYKWLCKECDNEFYDDIYAGRLPRCPTCYPMERSKEEQEIFNWTNSLQIGEVDQNNREIIPPQELDIYIPKYNLAIEYNGVYWHSETFILDKHYHQNKVKLCNNKNIRLLHIWEDEWLEDSENIKNKILHYINNTEEKIYPREPILEERMGYKIWN